MGKREDVTDVSEIQSPDEAARASMRSVTPGQTVFAPSSDVILQAAAPCRIVDY